MACRVQAEISETQTDRVRRLLASGDLQRSMYAIEELRGRKRPRDVFISSLLQERATVFIAGLGTKHQHGNVTRPLLQPQGGAKSNRIEAGERRLEQDRVGSLGAQMRAQGRGIVGRQDTKIARQQYVFQGQCQTVVLSGQQNACLRCPSLQNLHRPSRSSALGFPRSQPTSLLRGESRTIETLASPAVWPGAIEFAFSSRRSLFFIKGAKSYCGQCDL